ncbi:hypothetical protein WJX81_003166 [Elliptochloris bilobata]|uniref:2-(3-amino-3-carboxypropyl)histidine synthase subunit 1 n=1 Tax=Elliptochloris bilobata TaxID=381761 RepID=A0AAW1RXM8_9CHLO
MPTSRVGGPAPTTARLGRELQRYSQDGERLLAGCIPVRVTSPSAGVDGIEVLLITSSGGKGLVFPKGGWETDETLEAAAARETVEEAGVRGSLEEPLLGTFPYFSGKIAGAGMARGRCIAHMFAMLVAEELPTWPEGSTRERVWCSVPEAMRRAQRFVRQQVPDEVLHDAALNAAIAVLPANYNFEIHKTVWRIRQAGAKRVALQFPEGLLMFAFVIADILESHAGTEHCLVLGDVAYGACCVDDLSAGALGAQLLVHYGHSCLVPVSETTVPCMYVFVDIKVDVPHLVDTVRLNFQTGSRLAMAGTIQFAASLQLARRQLADVFPALAVPQAKPLSPGEVLGCTAPVVAGGVDAIVFVADGRFHLEAIMIANPDIPAYRYDPYARVLTRETYDQAGMRAVRRAAVEAACGARVWGLVLGMLGRQGNPRVLRHLQAVLEKLGLEHVVVLLSEVAPAKLARLAGPEAWVQVACPRLSIDWGEGFALPTLTPFEALVALGEVPPWWEAEVPAGSHAPYPMDYYARDGGVWSSSHHRAPAQSAAAG